MELGKIINIPSITYTYVVAPYWHYLHRLTLPIIFNTKEEINNIIYR